MVILSLHTAKYKFFSVQRNTCKKRDRQIEGNTYTCIRVLSLPLI